MTTATLLAGVPIDNQALYHRIRFAVGDAAAYIEWSTDPPSSLLLVRDIEMQRATQHARADRIGCAAQFAPAAGLSGDRDTALAQATAHCLHQSGVTRVTTDRTLPFIFAWHVQQAGIELDYDPDLGVLQRRVKDGGELAALRQAQAATEEAMRMACEWIAGADVDDRGMLRDAKGPLTSERVRAQISVFLLERGYSNHHDSIVCSVPHVADCHHRGTGPLPGGQPVIVDIFPRNNETRYWGDCTRTVVQGKPTAAIEKMHAAVMDAKRAAIDALRPGVSGEAVHAAATERIERHGYQMGPPPEGAAAEFTSMRHGTGHGIGLDVHEPILLDKGAGRILTGEVFTVEPGLYSQAHGGVRVEDMVAVSDDGPQNFNRLPEGLDWRS